jgi:hypothetical protein
MGWDIYHKIIANNLRLCLLLNDISKLLPSTKLYTT